MRYYYNAVLLIYRIHTRSMDRGQKNVVGGGEFFISTLPAIGVVHIHMYTQYGSNKGNL